MKQTGDFIQRPGKQLCTSPISYYFHTTVPITGGIGPEGAGSPRHGPSAQGYQGLSEL